MTTATMENEQADTSALSTVFGVAAIGGLASLAFFGAAAPLTLAFGATAAISGVGAAVQSMPSAVSISVITAAATTFALGLPMEFLTEHIVFPYAHESALGKETIGWSSSVLVPFYDSVGQFFGVEPLGQAIEGVPAADF